MKVSKISSHFTCYFFTSHCYPGFLLTYKLIHKIKIAAIISYKSLPLKKEVKKLIHLVLHAIAIVLGIIGICAAFKNHNESGIANLYSLHSWLGIGVISLYGIQVNYLIVLVLSNWKQDMIIWSLIAISASVYCECISVVKLTPCHCDGGFYVS